MTDQKNRTDFENKAKYMSKEEVTKKNMREDENKMRLVIQNKEKTMSEAVRTERNNNQNMSAAVLAERNNQRQSS